MAKFKHIEKKEYDTIKLLQQAGLSGSKTAAVTNRSNSVVCAIYKTETFEEYKRKAYERIKASLARNSKAEQSPEPVETNTQSTDDALVRALNNIYEMLEEINGRVKWIEGQTEVKPRRRLFS